MNIESKKTAETKHLTERPFFSIISLVFNVENFLRECLDSMRGQTFSDFEVILIDDGSTDSSGEICEEYAKTDPRFHVYHQKNKGLFRARTVGFSKAKGRYLMTVDSDDFIRKDALDLLHKAIEENKVDMVVFDISQNPDFLPNYDWPISVDGNVPLGKEKLVEAFLSTSCMNSMCRKCFRNGIAISLEETNKCDFVSHGEDAILSLKPIDMTKSWIYVPEPLYYYRPNQKSMTHTYQPKMWSYVKAVTQMTLEYAKKWDEDFGSGDHYQNMAKTKALVDAMYCVAIICRAVEDDKEAMRLLKEIREDPLFIDLYKNGNKGVLRPKPRIFGKLLWGNHYGIIRLIRLFL